LANFPEQASAWNPIGAEKLTVQSESALSGEYVGYKPTPIFEAFEA